MPAVADLGVALHADWRATGFRREAFAELAHASLQRAALHRAFSPADILEWVFESDCLPTQHDALGRFGQPPVTLFHDDRFSISALFWIDVDTSIHQHSFSGAFTVLSGTSLQRTFRFEQETVVSEALAHGRLVPGPLEMLEAGDCVAIESGPAFIHSVLHAARPTVSLVIRTHREPQAMPQWNYHRSGLAESPFYEQATLSRVVQVARSMATVEDRNLPRRLADFVARCDPWSAFRLLHAVDGVEFGRRSLPESVRATRRRFGAVGDAIVDSVYDARIDQGLAELRRRAETEALREFLTFVLGADGREEIQRCLRLRDPARDPVAWTLEALAEVLRLDPKAQEVAGPVALEVVRELLAGKSFAELQASGVPGIPAKEAARLSLMLPSLCAFRVFTRDAASEFRPRESPCGT